MTSVRPHIRVIRMGIGKYPEVSVTEPHRSSNPKTDRIVCVLLPLKICADQSSRTYDLKALETFVCMWYVIMLQDHRYLESPILGVQRRFRVKGQHPNSQPPHTSNSVKNCAYVPPPVRRSMMCIHKYTLNNI
jgi:hypothetical protein